MCDHEIAEQEMSNLSTVEVQQPKRRHLWTRVVHSFGSRDKGRETALGDAEQKREAGDLTRLNRKLKTRHLQMIAIGGSIGCGKALGGTRSARPYVRLPRFYVGF